MTFDTLKEAKQAAIHKGKKMKEQNPDAIIFIIYDKKAQQYDALTDEQLEEIYHLQQAAIKGWHITIKCEL